MKPRQDKKLTIAPVAFKIVSADSADDRRILLQLAATCKKAGDLFERYNQSLASRTRNQEPIQFSNDASPEDVEEIKLSELCHKTPSEFFSSAIQYSRDFGALMAEMAAWFRRVVRPGKRRPNKGLPWLIVYVHQRLWNGRGNRVYWNRDHYDGNFLDRMEQILRQIGYEVHSRDALGEACLNVLRKQTALERSLAALDICFAPYEQLDLLTADNVTIFSPAHSVSRRRRVR